MNMNATRGFLNNLFCIEKKSLRYNSKSHPVEREREKQGLSIYPAYVLAKIKPLRLTGNETLKH